MEHTELLHKKKINRNQKCSLLPRDSSFVFTLITGSYAQLSLPSYTTSLTLFDLLPRGCARVSVATLANSCPDVTWTHTHTHTK